ncbi:hypothetical protein Riv7116_0416 [Rivularia sp. PCC 7116]|nr:hypothetical protein Riv7116_0416 [Rivularia sp. PCC 7116]
MTFPRTYRLIVVLAACLINYEQENMPNLLYLSGIFWAFD